MLSGAGDGCSALHLFIRSISASGVCPVKAVLPRIPGTYVSDL